MVRRTADQLLELVKQIAKMDLAELGENVTLQNTRLYDFLSLSMHKLAKLAYQVRISDPLTLADGYVTFKVGATNIDDIFQPVAIYTSATGVEAPKRQAFSGGTGWYWVSENLPIHNRGLAGDHVLHYIKYPAWITAGSQVPEFPPSGYYALIFECASLIKQSKNYYEESNAMLQLAQRHYANVFEGSLAPGHSSGNPLSAKDLSELRG